jgi:hypothetical protein
MSPHRAWFKAATRPLAIMACMYGTAYTSCANVITDWDENAIAMVASMPPNTAQRWMAMVHTAMFDAVNSIEPRYRPYMSQLSAVPGTSKEAAAATAAAAILAAVDAKVAERVKALEASYLKSVPDGEAKSDGIKLGEAVAAKILQARANDGSAAVDDYRPRTSAGVYIPTAVTAGSMWPAMKPFAITKPSQFRPAPPVSLASDEWAASYSEIKDYGGKASAKRSAQQTEIARFWLMVGARAYHPFARQLVIARQMNVADSARFMALVAVGLTDAYIAVFDAKYHYNFWRPITAIRNGDIDGNRATDRDAEWQPLDLTPMHPEYPCAHCIQSGALASIVEAALGVVAIPEVAMTSATAPDVTHRWTDLAAFTDEVANARIWAGFHYRFSTRVGTEMGRRLGEFVVNNVMQPNAELSR